MNQSTNRRPGFTLIELMLAMTYVALLLLAIAMTTMQIGRIYNKGVTLKNVNQVGRDVTDELQRSIAAVPPFDVPTHYVNPVGGSGGRLCLGTYSYVWNYGAALAGVPGTQSLMNVYDDPNAGPIHLAKVSDTGAALCTKPYGKIPKADAVELLTGGDHDLVVHQFQLAETQRDNLANQALYAITLSIGTNDQTQLESDDLSCKAPANGAGNEDFCSVNRFDLMARAGNKQEAKSE